MSIPTAIPSLEVLYHHWPKYQEFPECKGKDFEVALDTSTEEGFWDFMKERMNIWHRRNSGLPAPWTEDEVIQKYRFTNIYRELDWQTQVWHTWLKQFEYNFDLWFMNMLHCRLVCKPDTIDKVGFLAFSDQLNETRHQAFLDLPSPRSGSSYNFAQYESMLMGYEGRHDVYYVHVPKVAKACARVFKSGADSSIHDMTEDMVIAFEGRMRFILAEVIMDSGYQKPQHVNEFKMFPIGPGASPMCKELNKKAKVRQVALTLMSKQPSDFPYLIINGRPVFLTTAAIEQGLCEYRKYKNIKFDNGRSRPFTPRK